MIRHVMRIVWNRKRSTGLMMTELLISFLVLCVVFTMGSYYWDNWRKPLGFEVDDVWYVGVSFPVANRRDMDERASLLVTAREVLTTMRSHPQVATASPAGNVPYSGNNSSWGTYLPDLTLMSYLWSEVAPDFGETMGIKVESGRWLEDGDEVQTFTPTVISRSMAKLFFGNEDPLGKDIPLLDKEGQPREVKYAYHVQRVVGVVETYRKAGELGQAQHAVFVPVNLHDPERGLPPWEYVIRVAPGTPASFEEPLIESLQRVAPDWSFDVTPLAQMRSSSLKRTIMPLLILAVVAGFLVLMVGMGLVGVLWQNVSRRTQELGLRRALGATTGSVYGQILGELIGLTTIAVGIGTALFLQVPLLQLMDFVPGRVFVLGAGAALLLIYPFVLICGLYPSWLATRVQPAQALQYE